MEIRLDGRGRPYTAIMLPENRYGVKPANAGRRYPPEPLTHDEVARLLSACGRRGPTALRNRALIVVMWRAGLRVREALDLELRDFEAGPPALIRVREGKGRKARVVGVDPQAVAVIQQWLDERRRLGVPRGSRLFCTIQCTHLGYPVWDSYVRERLKQLAEKAGIEKRVHPHGLRHTHASELMREGTPLVMIQRQLGHRDLATTARYVDHISPQERLERLAARHWPGGIAA